MSEKQFGVYGKLVESPNPLLTEKECLDISKCLDKTQLVVEVYEAVGRIRSKYDDYLLDQWSNDSLRNELHRLISAIVAYCRGFLFCEKNVSDAIEVAMKLYCVHLESKHKGFDVSRIVNKAKINPNGESE